MEYEGKVTHERERKERKKRKRRRISHRIWEKGRRGKGMDE